MTVTKNTRSVQGGGENKEEYRMAVSITVDPQKLEAASQQISTEAAEYESIYRNLFTEVDNMSAAWQGADNLAFTNQIKGFTDNFQDMKKLMDQYSEFLKSAAQMYRQTQDDRVAQAKNLTN
ncbi:WXG100 family type VII secretion target [Hydrogeniiclostridium mannosilyticum]|nr:WXG100 family type VII secretion target [Hydrogeniiclostridium mannosilyticum]